MAEPSRRPRHASDFQTGEEFLRHPAREAAALRGTRNRRPCTLMNCSTPCPEIKIAACKLARSPLSPCHHVTMSPCQHVTLLVIQCYCWKSDAPTSQKCRRNDVQALTLWALASIVVGFDRALLRQSHAVTCAILARPPAR